MPALWLMHLICTGETAVDKVILRCHELSDGVAEGTVGHKYPAQGRRPAWGCESEMGILIEVGIGA